MIDTHCHLDDPRLVERIACVLERAHQVGVTDLVCAGYAPDRWPRQHEIVARHAQVVPAYGLHPWAVGTDWARHVEELKAWLRAHPAAALGETGLDRGPRVAPESYPLQERAFEAQLELARQLDLPLILHVVRAHDRVAARLRPGHRGVVHSYSGSAEQLRPYLERGFYISFSGGLTRGSKKLERAARAAPRDRLLVETDAPDQTPRGAELEVNEPAALPAVIEKLAALRGESPGEVAEYTAKNARRCFPALEELN